MGKTVTTGAPDVNRLNLQHGLKRRLFSLS
jgi:hypothetical protein